LGGFIEAGIVGCSSRGIRSAFSTLSNQTGSSSIQSLIYGEVPKISGTGCLDRYLAADARLIAQNAVHSFGFTKAR
jgi:hypothetical protein